MCCRHSHERKHHCHDWFDEFWFFDEWFDKDFHDHCKKKKECHDPCEKKKRKTTVSLVKNTDALAVIARD